MSGLKHILSGLLRPPGTYNSSGRDKRKGARAVRRMLVLKDDRCYRHCLKQLRSLGVLPVKAVRSARLLVCRFPPHTDFRTLEQHPMVQRVEPDHRFRLHRITGRSSAPTVSVTAACASVRSPQRIPWGIERIGAPGVWTRSSGSPVRVAVLDTGVSAHPDLRLSGRRNTIKGAPAADENGHGTHVAGTIAALNNAFGVAGVAPKARLYAVKAFDRSGYAFASDIVEGLDWCIRNGMHVINMSFGMVEVNESVREQLRRAYRRGIVLVASAGNNGTASGRIDFPARLPEVIAVAASTRSGGIASFSSRGSGIAVAAPGENVCSTAPGGGYALMSGTSMAAPHVSGTAALLLSRKPGLGPVGVRRLLRATAKPLPGFPVQAQGSGLVQAKPAYDRA